MMTDHEIEATCRRVSGHLAGEIQTIKQEGQINKAVLERLERTILKGDADGGMIPLTMRVRALEQATSIQDLRVEMGRQDERIDGILQQNKEQKILLKGIGIGLTVITLGGSAGVYAIMNTLLSALGGGI
jgi:hypothetical protein